MSKDNYVHVLLIPDIGLHKIMQSDVRSDPAPQLFEIAPLQRELIPRRRHELCSLLETFDDLQWVTHKARRLGCWTDTSARFLII